MQSILMKKKIFIGALFLLLLVFAVPSLAADYGLSDAGTKAGYQETNVFTFTGKVINMGLSLLAILFLGVMLYAGIRWMTARGNEEYSTKAKTALEAGIIGLIIVLSAYAITTFVMQRLT